MAANAEERDDLMRIPLRLGRTGRLAIFVKATVAACLFCQIQAGAQTLFKDDFESDSSLFFWQHQGEDAANIVHEAPFSGTGAIEVSLGSANYLYREVLLHKSDELATNGFYTRLYFKIIPSPTFDPTLKTTADFNIFSFELLTFKEKGCLNPWIYSMGVFDGKFSLAIGVRDGVAGNPDYFPHDKSCMLVGPGTWHCLELFLALRNDMLFDSLFFDGTFMVAQKILFREKAESFKALILGATGTKQTSGVRSIMYDNLTVSSRRIGPEPSIPVITHPQQDESYVSPSPTFTWTSDNFTDSVAFEISSFDNIHVTDSLFYCRDTVRFSTPFTDNTGYRVKARAKNIFGAWSAWSDFHPFFVSHSPIPVKIDTRFSVSLDQSLHNRPGNLFYYNDSMVCTIGLPTDSIETMYMLLNVSHESFTNKWDKRWKIFDPAKNWIFNISLRKEKLLYIHSGGKWVPLSEAHFSGSAIDTKMMPLVWERTAFTNRSVALVFAFKTIHEAGIWHISTQFVERGGKTSYAPPVFFVIQKRPFPRWIIISLAALVSLLLGTTIIRYILKKKAAAALITPAMTETARTITRFLNEHYQEKLSNEDIGRVVGLSGHRAVSIYKTIISDTPFSTLTNIRIERAKELLAAGIKSVSETAYETGFSDLRLFQRNFKKITGMTPTDFREKK